MSNNNSLRDLLDSSYHDNKKAHLIGEKYGYVLDHELSTKNHKVYTDKEGRPTIVFRGTASKGDVMTDVALATGHHKRTPKYKRSQKTVAKVRTKYPDKELTAVGHSLWGKLAEGVCADKVVTYNKAIGSKDIGRKRGRKQVDVRDQYDPVSSLIFTQRRGKTIKKTPRGTGFLSLNHHSLPDKI